MFLSIHAAFALAAVTNLLCPLSFLSILTQKGPHYVCVCIPWFWGVYCEAATIFTQHHLAACCGLYLWVGPLVRLGHCGVSMHENINNSSKRKGHKGTHRKHSRMERHLCPVPRTKGEVRDSCRTTTKKNLYDMRTLQAIYPQFPFGLIFLLTRVLPISEVEPRE